MLLYVVFLLVSLSFLLFVYLSWNEEFWLKQRVPFIEPEKIFGNIRDVVLMKRTIGEVYQDIYNKLNGKPLGGFFKMRQPILMIRDPELISEVLQRKFDCFHDNDIHIRRDTDPILKMNPFLATGSTWRATRQILLPLQSNETLEGMLKLMKGTTKEIIQLIRKQELPIEINELCSKFTSNVIASCALGMDSNSLKAPDSMFRHMSDKIMKRDIKSNAALLFALYAPILGKCFSFRIISKDVCNYFVGLISERCKFRVREGVKRSDFLQRIIDINKESEANGEGTVYNYDQITGQCMTIFISGYKMTSHPLSLCLYELAMNPDVQQKLKNEIKSFGISSIDELSYYVVQSMEYLDMVLSESLRLHPPKQTITRICTSETELTHGEHVYKVGSGIPVTIPVHALHMDPTYFPDPLQFKPERFTKTERAARHPYAYLPFGGGPRVCPGAKFATLIMKVAIVGILMNFEVVPRGNIKGIEHDPRSSLLLTPKGGIWLRFKENVVFY